MSLTYSSLPSVDLDVVELDFPNHRYQALIINQPRPSELISPLELAHLALPENLDLSREVILFGQAPNWLYCYLIDQCYEAPWIGCYNAPLGQVVIIHSKVSAFNVGDAISPLLKAEPGMAILIGGPPDSGKSLLSNALRQSIHQHHPSCRLSLHRANWDGQGNWSYESPDVELTEELIRSFDAKLHWHPEAEKLIPKYFEDQARSIQNLRKVRDLVLVDVGGVPQASKHPVVQACSHYMVISKDTDSLSAWHQLCATDLACLAVIHSKPSAAFSLLSQTPHLEMVVGRKELAEQRALPQPLLHAISNGLKLEVSRTEKPSNPVEKM